MNKEQFESDLFNKYYNERTIPCPTITEALSQMDFSSCMPFNKAQKFLINNFNIDCIKTYKSIGKTIDLPINVVTFIVPLDFYIPINQPYSAILCSSGKNEEQLVISGTIFTTISLVNGIKYRTSSILCSICGQPSDVFISNNDRIYDNSEIIEIVVDCCNRIIGSYETIPGRHTHYMHRITDQLLPSEIQYFIFKRTTKRIIDNGSIIANNNVLSDLYNSEVMPSKNELSMLSQIHVNYDGAFINVIDLILKIKDATHLVCKGMYADSILLADNFAELCMGYLYCEARRVIYGEEITEIIDNYKNINKKLKEEKKSWYKELSETFKYQSAEKYKKAICHDEYISKCRGIRDDLTHRFLLKKISGKDAEEALISVCRMIENASKIAYDLMPDSSDKLAIALLIDSVEFPLRTVR